MPKKRHFNFKPLQGSATSTSSQNKPNGNDNSPSVNERLSELRRLEGKDAAARRRQLAESVNQRSVPPDAQRILGVSESAPPKPRKDVSARARDRLRGTPGPAPPKSWSKGGGVEQGWGGSSLVLRGKRKANANESERDRPKDLLRFARLTATLDEGEVDGRPPRLAHLAYRTVARLWDEYDEADYPALVDIPLRLRLRLLSYIVYYGPPITPTALDALLQGGDSVTHLDLAGLIGHRGLSLRKIQRYLEQNQQTTSCRSDEAVVESWDAEDSLETTLQSSLLVGRFSQLTHLSLSHPNPSGVSWSHLLALTKHTPQVTHLSLAYWPRPTLTPNLSTATISTPTRQEVSAGGSNYYSAMDSDMEEPASLLRQLSSNLLCLQWLDLEGCGDWLPALARLAFDLTTPSGNLDRRHARWFDHGERQEIEPSKNTTSVFVTNWKNLVYIRCPQPELPTAAGLQALFADSSTTFSNTQRKIAAKLNAYFCDGSSAEGVQAMLQQSAAPQEAIEVQKKRAMLWLAQERKAVRTALRINDIRKHGGARTVVFDHGWMQTSTSRAASGY